MAAKTPSQAAATERLMKYWTTGEGGLKIRWGEAGDFDRCVRALRDKVPASVDVKGLCSNLHKRATGARPGKAASEQK
jgi:hypothetical protein